MTLGCVESALKKLDGNKSHIITANAVVLLFGEQHVYEFFKLALKAKHHAVIFHRIWLAATVWGDRVKAPAFEFLPYGLIGLVPNTPFPWEFCSYLQNMSLTDLEDTNMWLADYIEHHLPFMPNHNHNVWDALIGNLLPATDLSSNITKLAYISDAHINWDPAGIASKVLSSVPEVINAVYVIGLALSKVLGSAGPDSTKIQLLEQLFRMHFKHDAKFYDLDDMYVKRFDEWGNIELGYLVMNLQKRDKDVKEFVNVGRWDFSPTYSGTLIWEIDRIRWPRNFFVIPESNCDMDCNPGQFRIYSSVPCCWTCRTCDDGTYSKEVNAMSCSDCNDSMTSNMKHTGCIYIEQFVTWTSPETITVLVLDGTGIILVLLTATVMALYRNTPVVICSNRKLTFVILVLIMADYGLPLLYVSPPTKIKCIAEIVIYSVVFSSITSIFLVKTWHVYQIFSSKVRRAKSQYTPLRMQQREVWLWLAIAFPLLIVQAAVIISRPPTPLPHIASCGDTWRMLQTISTAYVSILSVASAYMAFRARRLPENYNEAGCICSSVLMLMLVWVVSLLGYYFQGEVTEDIFIRSLCVEIAGFFIIVPMFVPKLYIIIFHPERNTRFYVQKMNAFHMWKRTNSSSRRSSEAPWMQRDFFQGRLSKQLQRHRSAFNVLSGVTLVRYNTSPDLPVSFSTSLISEAMSPNSGIENPSIVSDSLTGTEMRRTHHESSTRWSVP